MARLGSAVVAIGVFDGVHLGHQALLADTVADARAHGVEAVAVTFDRDPDQVVSPATAAPQLLTLGDKLGFMAATGVDAILVIPFTHELAEMCPEEFLDAVLLHAVRPLAVHVGGDFRFGCRATGDVGALQRSGAEHGFEVSPHELVASGGLPVTSSRIRSLVAARRCRRGSAAAGPGLLCRRSGPPRARGGRLTRLPDRQRGAGRVRGASRRRRVRRPCDPSRRQDVGGRHLGRNATDLPGRTRLPRGPSHRVRWRPVRRASHAAVHRAAARAGGVLLARRAEGGDRFRRCRQPRHRGLPGAGRGRRGRSERGAIPRHAGRRLAGGERPRSARGRRAGRCAQRSGLLRRHRDR